MGKVLSIWFPVSKSGKSVFQYILAKHLSNILDKDVKILICCLNLSQGNLLKLFRIENTELNLEDVVNFKMHPENKAFDLINAIARQDNIYFLGSKKTSPSYVGRNIKIYENLLEEVKQSFDLVILDTMSGTDSALTNMAIDKSDHVLNILCQDKEALDSRNFITGKDLAFVINMYRGIYPDEKDIKSIYKLKNTFTLPCCNQLQEMKNKDKLGFYIQHDTPYNLSIRKISEYIADKLELPVNKAVVTGKKRKNIFRSMLEGLK